MLQSPNSKNYNPPSIRLKTAYLFQLTNFLSKDEVDRLPSNIRVGWYDILSYIFSICTYVFDMGLDIWVAVTHYQHNRILAFILTIIFVAIPSFIINIISLFWWLDDRWRKNGRFDEDLTDQSLLKERLKHLKLPKKSKEIEMTDADFMPETNRNELTRWIFATVFQIAPLIWHFKALKSAFICMQIQKLARRERILYHRIYFEMIEADRDASVLRFFEALLESLPQLLIQAYFLMDDFKVSMLENQPEFDWKLRIVSMSVSLLCISFSFVSHHRTLRISLPDKQNLNITECNLILTWRFLSIFGRFTFLSILIYFQPHIALILFLVHLFLSTLHITIYQRIQMDTKFDFLDKLMILINVWIHVFAPFNMSQGRTRSRYLIGYGLEISEAIFIFCTITFFSINDGNNLIQSTGIFIWASILYVIGLLVMIGYFLFAHPSLNSSNEEIRFSLKSMDKN